MLSLVVCRSDKTMPKVSVIIPTYNRAHLVQEAIESVLNQTFRDFELIVVDDGSTDRTPEILGTWGKRIRCIRQENRGVSRARNEGIRVSRGKYIAFLDSDDLWVRKKLEVQTRFLDANPQFSACYTDEVWIRRGVRVNPRNIHGKHSGWIFDRCLPLCIISPSSVMLRRQALDIAGLFDESLPVCEDYDLWLRISGRFPVFFIDEKLIIKRGGHSDQLSNRSWGNDRYRVLALKKQLAQNHLSPSERTAALEMLQWKCRILANGCFKRGKTEEGMEYQKLAESLGAGTGKKNGR